MSLPRLPRPLPSSHLLAVATDSWTRRFCASCQHSSTAGGVAGKVAATVATLPLWASAKRPAMSVQRRRVTSGAPFTTAGLRPSPPVSWSGGDRTRPLGAVLPGYAVRCTALCSLGTPLHSRFRRVRNLNTYSGVTQNGLWFAFKCIAGFIALTTAAGTAWWYWNTSELRIYPKSVQRKLRQGMRARELEGNPGGATKAFQSALDELLADPSPPAKLAPDSAHVIGVMDQLAHTMVLQGRLPEATEVYRKAFAVLVDPADLDLRSDLGPAPPEGKFLRAVGIAQRLGDLYQQIGDADEAERYLVWSVRRLLSDPESQRRNEWRAQQEEGDDSRFVCPEWTTPADVAFCVEALGTFYTRFKGRHDLAVPMYLRALSLMDTKADPCHAAVLLNNVADCMTVLGRIDDARAWIAKGLELAEGKEDRECKEACAALLFNAGMVRELANDPTDAERWYEKAHTFAEKYGLTEAMAHAKSALGRFKSM